MPNLKEKEAEIMEDMKRQALEEIEERKQQGLHAIDLKDDCQMHHDKPYDATNPDSILNWEAMQNAGDFFEDFGYVKDKPGDTPFDLEEGEKFSDIDYDYETGHEDPDYIKEGRAKTDTEGSDSDEDIGTLKDLWGDGKEDVQLKKENEELKQELSKVKLEN